MKIKIERGRERERGREGEGGREGGRERERQTDEILQFNIY